MIRSFPPARFKGRQLCYATFGPQRDNAYVIGHIEFAGHVPSSLVYQHERAGPRRYGE